MDALSREAGGDAGNYGRSDFNDHRATATVLLCFEFFDEATETSCRRCYLGSASDRVMLVFVGRAKCVLSGEAPSVALRRRYTLGIQFRASGHGLCGACGGFVGDGPGCWTNRRWLALMGFRCWGWPQGLWIYFDGDASEVGGFRPFGPCFMHRFFTVALRPPLPKVMTLRVGG